MERVITIVEAAARIAEAQKFNDSGLCVDPASDYAQACDDCGAQIRNALSGRESESERFTGWLPIETAPRDGTPVDLWHRAGFRIVDTWWDGTDLCWSCVMDDSAFSHWRPVPEGPSS